MSEVASKCRVKPTGKSEYRFSFFAEQSSNSLWAITTRFCFLPFRLPNSGEMLVPRPSCVRRLRKRSTPLKSVLQSDTQSSKHKQREAAGIRSRKVQTPASSSLDAVPLTRVLCFCIASFACVQYVRVMPAGQRHACCAYKKTGS